VSAADKPFGIDKKLVYEPTRRSGPMPAAPGWSGQTIEQFEAELGDNLYKLWNRMSSGSYFPPPVRAVAIPKKTGGQRLLGVPTVADRVAQMVVKRMIEADLEAVFLADSYGYRPGKSALDAVGVTRSVAGNTTGFWNSTSRACSTTSTTRFCCGRFGNM